MSFFFLDGVDMTKLKPTDRSLEDTGSRSRNSRYEPSLRSELTLFLNLNCLDSSFVIVLILGGDGE